MVDKNAKMTLTDAHDLAAALQDAISGDVRDDRLHRALYATDASIYEMWPDVVVFPRTIADISATVRICSERGVPLTARGAGTGLAGGCVNRGVQLDCSRYLNRVHRIDAGARRCHVEPGVVLDVLNAQLKPHGLHFAVDVATASRATLGGMLANNSAGAHSVINGRTNDHTLAIDAVLADGSTHTWGLGAATNGNGAAHACEQAVAAVVRDYADEIKTRYPDVFRRNGGYALDRIVTTPERTNVEQLIVGSEGTLCVIAGATLDLTPLPKCKGMLVVHYRDLLESLASVPALLRHQPAAIELLDKYILDGTLDNPAMLPKRWFLNGDPAAILIVELYDDDDDSLERRLKHLAATCRDQKIGYAWPVIIAPAKQSDVWDVRKAGTGLLMSRPGDAQPYDFVDDCAVAPEKLHDYIHRLQAILRDEGVDKVGYYAHASVGLLHVRPALNLKQQHGVEQLRRIADRTASLVHEMGGAMTGEHGEGLVRSEWIERLFGPKLVEAFRKIKTAFDPRGVFNPGKIVDPLPMDANLRYGAGFTSANEPTMLDFSRHGGMAGLAHMCSGIGECRKTLVGTMCPSYMATGDEKDTTRARANALRLALSNKDLLTGLSDPQLADVMDLCLSCKACKTECPTGTDIAKLKAEWLHHRHEREGVDARTKLIADSVRLAPLGSWLAPLANAVMQSGWTRALMERRFGLDRRVPPPKFAFPPFRARRVRRSASLPADAPRVVFFCDTWTNYYIPRVGVATVRVLNALGCDVLIPRTVCCGRPHISKGLLGHAKKLAERNVALLRPYVEQGLPIVGAEPSCVSALVDELPQFVRTDEARRLASLAQTVEQFIASRLSEQPGLAERVFDATRNVRYHGHCHQKAMFGTRDALTALDASSASVSEINSGCCGMAGSFGHEHEHYDVAQACGEQRLFPAIRNRNGAEIVISGFSCRHQIEHHTGVHAKHVIEHLADALRTPAGE